MISQNRYINIVSGVGAGAAVAARQLVMRAITQNAVLPPNIVAEFNSPDAVGSYFGVNSEEYRRAVAYFGFINKQIQSPPMISFARWVSVAIAPMIIGDSSVKSLAAFTSSPTGSLTLVINGSAPIVVSPIDTTAATSLTDVAAIIQTALRAKTDPQLATTSTFTFNTNTNQFVLTGATTGSGSIVVTPTATAGDLAVVLGLGTTGSVLVNGQAPDIAEQAVSKSADLSNNFGSFVFVTPSTPFTPADMAQIAAWNDSQNNMYIYSLWTPLSALSAVYTAVKGYSGCAINISAQTGNTDFIEQSPCEILASTNYNSIGAVQNYMFYQFPSRVVTVSTDTNADLADANRANYIGVTQTAGQQLAFYQRGVLCGGPNDAVDMNVYANEMWFKSDITRNLFDLFLNVGRVPANDEGEATVLAIIQQSIDLAKSNGTISVGKELTMTQKQYINQLTGDIAAWRQVQTIGYWISVGFDSRVTTDGRTEWFAIYTLIYSKDDAIRAVNGRDIMI